MANTSELKAQAIGQVVGCIIGFGAAFLLAWLFSIEGGKEYGWFAGIFHGSWAPINWIRDLLFGGIYVKAPLCTSAYSSYWWVFLVLGVLCYLRLLVNTIIALRYLLK